MHRPFYFHYKLIALVLIFAMLLLSSCTKEDYEDQIEIGMTLDEYYAIVPEDGRVDFLNFSCFTAADGKSVVVKFRNDSPFVVFSVDAVDSAVMTEESFSKVEKEMTFLETVELIGLPREQLQMDVIALEYDAQDGKKYRVYFKQKLDNEQFDLYVSETAIVEK